MSNLLNDQATISDSLSTSLTRSGRPLYRPLLRRCGVSHGAAQRLHEDIAFRVLAANNTPDFRTISDFRRGMLGPAYRYWRCASSGALGHVALDGTKVKANASKHRCHPQVATCRAGGPLRLRGEDTGSHGGAGSRWAGCSGSLYSAPPHRIQSRRIPSSRGGKDAKGTPWRWPGRGARPIRPENLVHGRVVSPACRG